MFEQKTSVPYGMSINFYTEMLKCSGYFVQVHLRNLTDHLLGCNSFKHTRDQRSFPETDHEDLRVDRRSSFPQQTE